MQRAGRLKNLLDSGLARTLLCHNFNQVRGWNNPPSIYQRQEGLKRRFICMGTGPPNTNQAPTGDIATNQTYITLTINFS